MLLDGIEAVIERNKSYKESLIGVDDDHMGTVKETMEGEKGSSQWDFMSMEDEEDFNDISIMEETNGGRLCLNFLITKKGGGKNV